MCYAIFCLPVSPQLGNEHDKALPDPSLWRVVRASAPEWYLILTGVIASAIDGGTFPIVSVFMGRLFEVCSLHVSVCTCPFIYSVSMCQLWLFMIYIYIVNYRHTMLPYQILGVC